MNDDIVHENKTFTVEIGAAAEANEAIEFGGALYWRYYIVVNKDSEVVEYKTPGIIDAIAYAENTMRALDAKPWEWIDKAAALSGKVVNVEDMN